MEDYDIFNEIEKMKNKKSLIIVEDDEKFILENVLESDFEIIPIRMNYDLSIFSNDYVEKTKELFTFYYNENNSCSNEILRLKKHLIHYQKNPSIAYIPNDSKYSRIKDMMIELGIKCVSSKKKLIKVIDNEHKLIFVDSDDTLKRSDGTISERTKKAILENRKKGNKIIVCTARPRYQTLDVMNEAGADNIIVSSNGSEIYDSENKKIIYNSFIDSDEVIRLVGYAYSMDIRLILTMEDFDYVTKTIRNSNQVLLDENNYKDQLKDCNVKQCMFIDKKCNEITEIKKIILKNKALAIVDEINENSSYEEKWFSIVNSNSSKGNALKILADYLNIPIEKTIAIGNDKNDVSMFESAGLSVSVANALDNIKERADYTTLSNDEDGVAYFLESLLK